MSVETPPPYRVAQSPSLDLAIPPDAPHVPPSVAEASQRLRGSYELCRQRVSEILEARDALEGAHAQDRHAQWLASEAGDPDPGTPHELAARERIASAERLADAATNSWKLAARELGNAIYACRGEWLEQLNEEIGKLRGRMQQQIDRLQSNFDALERLQLLVAGIAEIPEAPGHLSAIAMASVSAAALPWPSAVRARCARPRPTN